MHREAVLAAERGGLSGRSRDKARPLDDAGGRCRDDGVGRDQPIADLAGFLVRFGDALDEFEVERGDEAVGRRHALPALGKPVLEVAGRGGPNDLKSLLLGSDRIFGLRETFLSVRVGQLQDRRRHEVGKILVGYGTGFVDVLEECRKGVEVLLRERVVLVVVAAGAVEGHPEHGGAVGRDAIVDVGDPVLLVDNTALFVLGMESIERGGQPLIARGRGQEVAGELFREEAIVGQVAVKRLDDPVAIRPHGAWPIHLVTVSVGIAREIEPVGGHAFAVARGCEQAVDHALVSAGRGIADEGVDFGQ